MNAKCEIAKYSALSLHLCHLHERYRMIPTVSFDKESITFLDERVLLSVIYTATIAPKIDEIPADRSKVARNLMRHTSR